MQTQEHSHAVCVCVCLCALSLPPSLPPSLCACVHTANYSHSATAVEHKQAHEHNRAPVVAVQMYFRCSSHYCARTHARASTHARAMHGRAHTHAHTHARTHTHTHARTRTYAHTCIIKLLPHLGEGRELGDRGLDRIDPAANDLLHNLLQDFNQRVAVQETWGGGGVNE